MDDPSHLESPGPVLESIEGHVAEIGPGFPVRRLLPRRQRRTVGPWCFVDHMGPVDLARLPPLRVPPHPHTGLSTVTWITQGVLLHKDSLGSVQEIRPGEVNLMVAGHGVAHSEEAVGTEGLLEGIQLWAALPPALREATPTFEHHGNLPAERIGGVDLTVFIGEGLGHVAPPRTFSPMVGMEGHAAEAADLVLPLERAHEHALVIVSGGLLLDRRPLGAGALHYLGRGRSQLVLGCEPGSRFLLLGGAPYDAPLFMWWNLVGSDRDDIARARADWQAGRRFGPVPTYDGPPTPAPPL